MLSFGMPTLIETSSLRECASLCRTLGLQFVEINMNLPQYQPHLLNTEKINQIAAEFGVRFTFHLDENLNISDFNPRVAAAYRETVRETIALAREIHAPVINMHLSRGVYFTLPDQRVYLFDEYWPDYLESILSFRQDCMRCISDAGIIMAIENTDGFTDFQKEALDVLLESEVFALTLDTGHSHTAGGADEAEILSRPGALHHMHLHDAYGKANHLPLGAGSLDIPKYLAIAQENNCRVVLETKTVEGLTQSVRWLKVRGLI